MIFLVSWHHTEFRSPSMFFANSQINIEDYYKWHTSNCDPVTSQILHTYVA